MSERMAGGAPTVGRTVIRNVFAMIAARGVAAVVGLVSLPIVYTRLGARDFGIWAVLSGLTTIVALADLGLGSAIIRQVAAATHAREPEANVIHRTRVALGIGLVWGVALAIIGAVAVFATWTPIASLLQFDDASAAARSSMVWLMLALLMDGIALPWRSVLEGTQRYDATGWINGSTAVLGGTLTVLAVVSDGGLPALGAAVAATSAVRTAAIVAVARRNASVLSPSLAGAGRDDIRALGSYGMRVQVTSASGAVNLELDRFILTASSGPAVAGAFELGARVVNLCRLVPVFALVALFPMAVANRRPSWLDRFNVTVTKYLTAFAAVGAAGLVACADPLIRLWLGEANSQAAACIKILAPAYAINLVAGATGILSRVEGRPGRETRYALLTMAINLALTWPLLQLLGPTGVPLATAIGIAVGTVHFIASYHRVTERPLAPLMRGVWPSIATAVVAGAAGLLVGSLLPDGTGRLGAALSVLGAGATVVVISGVLLSASGTVRAADFGRFLQVLRPSAPDPTPVAWP